MKKDLVVKDNALINASYSLDLVEQRLILLAIVEARRTGKGVNANDALSVHATSYMQSFNVERQPAYISLKKACDDLFLRQFSYQTVNENGNIQNHRARWVSEIIYVESEATIKLIFSPAVVPLVTELEKHFTSYELEQVSGLSSAYAVRLYEILIAWRSTGKVPLIKLDEFRNRLGVGVNEYNAMHNFKSRVLEPAIKQVNEHTDIIASYEQHKAGRKITGLSFSFKQKRKEVIKKSGATVVRKSKSSAWGNGENATFAILKSKCVGLTKSDVEALAIKEQSDVATVLSKIYTEYANVDNFTLRKP